MKIYKDISLSTILWYGIGGKARYLLEVGTTKDIVEAIAFLQEQKIPKTLIVGSGSNLLVNDAYFDGAVIHLIPGENTLQLQNKAEIAVFAGATMDNLIQFGFAHNLIGLEWAGGLPGTVGGAIRGNAGAFGSDVAKNVKEVQVVRLSDPTATIFALSHADLAFSYRNSYIKQQHDMLIVSASFSVIPATEKQLEEAKKTYSDHIIHREKNNPLEYPSCGSTFKNITAPEEIEKILAVWPDLQEKVHTQWKGKISVGYLIKQLGFSGFQIGNAKISEKHANFILNLGEATFTDVVTIIEKIQQRFRDTFGYIPQPEVEIIR